MTGAIERWPVLDIPEVANVSFGPMKSWLIRGGVVAALTLVAPRSEATCDCNCYWGEECASTEHCSWGWCAATSSSDPSAPVGDPSKWDGVCTDDVEPTCPSCDGIAALMAMEQWLLAWEDAAKAGGGFPVSARVEDALAQALSERQHRAIRQYVQLVQVLYLGPSYYPDKLPHKLGFYDPPAIPPVDQMVCDARFPAGDVGSLGPVDPAFLPVGAKIREAILGEMKTPGKGVFQNTMAQIPTVAPDYAPFQRCEFPHPSEHMHPFIYPDGLACLTGELFAGLDSLSTPAGGDGGGGPGDDGDGGDGSPFDCAVQVPDTGSAGVGAVGLALLGVAAALRRRASARRPPLRPRS